MNKISSGLVLSALLLINGSVLAADLNVYGPGDPAPVIKKLAKLFTEQTGKEVTVIAGLPAGSNKQQATSNTRC